MNALFVANKPSGIGSNQFLSQIKRRYGVKKAGFSGTLDPFASGSLIIAFGNRTKLFNYIDKVPKIYIATMWLGASSQSLDNENLTVLKSPILNLADIKSVMNELVGEISYTPPKFSAKQIGGKRAYDLVRNGVEFELKTQIMQVFWVEILSYMHPFLTFKISVSEGSYIRSYAQLIAQKLNVTATLSALRRCSEGKFKFENERFLDPLEFINLPRNEYFGSKNDIELGKKIDILKLKFKENGLYLINFDNFFSIIEIQNSVVKYKLNKVEKC
ncbi:MAG: tRNA pseudouridine(55) synthase TruB [Campylobacter sp.]